MAWVPDSFWKPEYEERMRSWIAKEYTGQGASLRGRVRLSKAGVALMRHYAETGTAPRQA